MDCIHEGPDQLFIDPEECIDCGACEPECPVEAIFPEDAVPQKWEEYIEKNKAFFNGAWGCAGQAVPEALGQGRWHRD